MTPKFGTLFSEFHMVEIAWDVVHPIGSDGKGKGESKRIG